MCCTADWKREVVPDHKFDFINVREFHTNDIWTRIKYIFKYILILKNLAVYGLDVFTATTYILSSHWTNAIQSRCGDNCAVNVQFGIAKWVFVGCIIFSFLLLGYESWKAHKVIKSRDISYAFTNLMANDYYSIKSYDNFCLFCRIDSSTKKEDKIAFFVYFTFKDWKRVLLADGPRQSINALTLYSFAVANGWDWSNLPAWWNNSPITAMLLFAICATVLLFVLSFSLLVIASLFYVPLLCYIQGNLKEYVCYKVDKRIAELIQRNRRDRIRRNLAIEKKFANGGVENAPGIIPQPTLPNVSLDDDDLKGGSVISTQPALQPRQMPRNKSNNDFVDYEAYGQPQPAYPPAYPSSNSYHSFDSTTKMYELDYSQYGSTTNLTLHAAPPGLSYPPATEFGSTTNLASHAAPPGLSYPPPSAFSYNPAQPSFPPRANSNSSLKSYDTRSDQRYDPPTSLPYDGSRGYR